VRLRCRGFPRDKENIRKKYHNERLVLAMSAIRTAIYGAAEYYVEETKTQCVETNCSEGLYLLTSILSDNAACCDEMP
jgi:hypothetical protein